MSVRRDPDVMSLTDHAMPTAEDLQEVHRPKRF
jgi:hypothetical protein